MKEEALAGLNEMVRMGWRRFDGEVCRDGDGGNRLRIVNALLRDK